MLRAVQLDRQHRMRAVAVTSAVKTVHGKTLAAAAKMIGGEGTIDTEATAQGALLCRITGKSEWPH